MKVLTDRYSGMDEVILYIQENIHEPLTLSRLAKYAAYSPYHFSRIFKERTGLSPLYYVSALRLQKAKGLLLNTDLTVRDIGYEIGQKSLGTFTTRFTERVGVSPNQFRNSRFEAEDHFKLLRHLNDWNEGTQEINQYPTVEGRVQSDVLFNGMIFIGLFTKPIPEGLPLYGTLLPNLGPFSFKNVKPGIYYILATSVSWGVQTKDILLPNNTLRTRTRLPIIFEPYSTVPFQHVNLYAPRLDDPPILTSLPLLMRRFLKRIRQNRNGEEI